MRRWRPEKRGHPAARAERQSNAAIKAKGHGTGNYIEGKSNIAPGALVALVEDVVTTGGTLLKVIDRVEAEGFKVGLVATIVDREEGGAATLAARGYPLKAVFTRAQLLGGS